MYKKILIPLDGTTEAEGVFSMLEGELEPDAEVILLHVVLPVRSRVVAGQLLDGTQIMETERSEALSYCRTFVDRLSSGVRQRCDVAVAESVADGIIDTAVKEGVDLIAMYTHDRKGFAKLLQKSIASDVRRNAPIEVKVYKPQELAVAT